jgi:hypothetical protein
LQRQAFVTAAKSGGFRKLPVGCAACTISNQFLTECRRRRFLTENKMP